MTVDEMKWYFVIKEWKCNEYIASINQLEFSYRFKGGIIYMSWNTFGWMFDIGLDQISLDHVWIGYGAFK